ncbi:MAG: hypothetical protein ACRDP4_07980 [Nocardioidaceae bacterium]
MNISEANATNQLLCWVFGIDHPATGGPVDDDRATDAARYLADQAHRKLMAGIDHRHIDEAWNAMKDDA